ncbi:MAG: hypothetical protein ISS72_02285 [Candidatus Brocadiae bacterium]|nr:hypothetical protein [Candidatus Brocadiia bacterium]
MHGARGAFEIPIKFGARRGQPDQGKHPTGNRTSSHEATSACKLDDRGTVAGYPYHS